MFKYHKIGGFFVIEACYLQRLVPSQLYRSSALGESHVHMCSCIHVHVCIDVNINGQLAGHILAM